MCPLSPLAIESDGTEVHNQFALQQILSRSRTFCLLDLVCTKRGGKNTLWNGKFTIQKPTVQTLFDYSGMYSTGFNIQSLNRENNTPKQVHRIFSAIRLNKMACVPLELNLKSLLFISLVYRYKLLYYFNLNLNLKYHPATNVHDITMSVTKF